MKIFIGNKKHPVLLKGLRVSVFSVKNAAGSR